MQDPKKSQDRRRLLAVSGTVGALAAAAAALPRVAPGDTPASAAAPDGPQTTSSGYRLTEHIKRYYSSTRI